MGKAPAGREGAVLYPKSANSQGAPGPCAQPQAGWCWGHSVTKTAWVCFQSSQSNRETDPEWPGLGWGNCTQRDQSLTGGAQAMYLLQPRKGGQGRLPGGGDM